MADIEHYAPKIIPGGWLVMDDAAYGLPGTSFWKGYETVARACLRLPDLGFDNVLNVGHNRVFERRA
jgi:alpha-D-ribose 1-methylphosphonate 5-triphosphate synthase subunit PhnG